MLMLKLIAARVRWRIISISRIMIMLHRAVRGLVSVRTIIRCIFCRKKLPVGGPLLRFAATLSPALALLARLLILIRTLAIALLPG
jgi:hypothetical protein